jgi:predicted lactoylglutathione lyase
MQPKITLPTVKRAQKTFRGGYAGYVQDPPGHGWEIAWNPGFDAPAGDTA